MKKILVIDDEQSYQVKIKFILEKSIKGCNVLSAKSGAEGIEIARREQPDTILLDVVMPEMDGYEVCEILKSDKQTKSIPIILASAFQKDTDSRVLGLKSGADVFLSKPFDPTELAAQVLSMLRIRKAERDIEKSNEKFRTVADYAYDWEYWVDTDDKLIYISPSCKRITGYNPSEFLDNPSLLANIVYSDDKEKVFNHKQKIAQGNKCESLEFRIITKGGELRWIGHVCQSVYGSRGNYTGIRASNRDITDRKIVEEEIKIQTLELFERNEELDAFAHTVAHDLRSPIGSIIGFADILKNSFHIISKDEINEFLTHIIDSGNKSLQILNSLLLLTNVRKADVPYEKLVMKEVVDETIKRLSEIVVESNAVINHPPSWPSSIGYAPWIEEIWVNYINNAIKYGGETPEVTIGFDFVTSEQDGAEMVRFWVRDNGLGISADDQKLLFQQFERLHQAKIKGHGLGLSIVRRIAHKLGGYVGVESELGKGSLFYFTLPKS